MNLKKGKNTKFLTISALLSETFLALIQEKWTQLIIKLKDIMNLKINRIILVVK
jgi:hypothetical protein